MTPTPEESAKRNAILTTLLDYIKQNQTIKLPELNQQEEEFGATVGQYRYQFEGEEDLLHLMITKQNEDPITFEEAKQVVTWLLPKLPTGLLWLKPGAYSQHFYFGHDELLR